MKCERKVILDETKKCFLAQSLPHLPKSRFFLINRPIRKFKAQQIFYFGLWQQEINKNDLIPICWHQVIDDIIFLPVNFKAFGESKESHTML